MTHRSDALLITLTLYALLITVTLCAYAYRLGASRHSFLRCPTHWQEDMYTHTTYTHTHHSGTAHVYSCVHFLRDSLVASAHKMPCIHSHSGAMYTLTHSGGRALGTRAHLVTFALIQNFPLRCTGYREKGGMCERREMLKGGMCRKQTVSLYVKANILSLLESTKSLFA